MTLLACIAHRLDYVFSPKILSRPRMRFIVFDDTPDAPFLRSLIPPTRVISCALKTIASIQEVSDEWLIRHSDLSQVLSSSKVSSFILSHQGSRYLDAWSLRHGLTLIGPTWKLTSTFENKIWFQQFLDRHRIPSPRAWVLQGSDIPRAKLPSRFVIQEPDSFGSFGTFFDVSKASLHSFLRRDVISPRKKYLIRELRSGQVFGISLLIRGQRAALSAPRLQCFFTKNSTEILFAGIQWIATKRLSPKLRYGVESMFSSLAHALVKEKGEGLFHFDFIATQNDEVLLLECNPRLSSATLQLHRVPELFGGSLREDRCFFEKDALHLPQKREIRLPESSYEGALLDVIALNPLVVRKDPLSLASSSLIFHSAVPPGTRLRRGDSAGAFISEEKLFFLSGRLNKRGDFLYRRALKVLR